MKQPIHWAYTSPKTGAPGYVSRRCNPIRINAPSIEKGVTMLHITSLFSNACLAIVFLLMSFASSCSSGKVSVRDTLGSSANSPECLLQLSPPSSWACARFNVANLWQKYGISADKDILSRSGSCIGAKEKAESALSCKQAKKAVFQREAKRHRERFIPRVLTMLWHCSFGVQDHVQWTFA